MNKIKNRLKRLEGQIRGLQKLLDKPEDCEQLLIQFLAAKSALDSCYQQLLTENLMKCFKNKEDKNLDKILKLIIKR